MGFSESKPGKPQHEEGAEEALDTSVENKHDHAARIEENIDKGVEDLSKGVDSKAREAQAFVDTKAEKVSGTNPAIAPEVKGAAASADQQIEAAQAGTKAAMAEVVREKAPESDAELPVVVGEAPKGKDLEDMQAEAGKEMRTDNYEKRRATKNDAWKKANEPYTGDVTKLPPESAFAFKPKEWNKLSLQEKLTYCKPDKLREDMADRLHADRLPEAESFEIGKKFEAADLAKVDANIDRLLAAHSSKELGNISKEYAETIGESMKEYAKLISEAGSKDGIEANAVNEVVEDLIKKMVFQQQESERRALGDHGVRHIIKGNIGEAKKIMAAWDESHDEKMNPLDKLKMMTVMLNHDMGYTVDVNRKGFGSTGDHPAFSRKIFESQADLYGKVFQPEDLQQMSEILETHDNETSDFSSKERGLESAIRLADNMALFHDNKMPELFYQDPTNVEVLQKIAALEKMYPVTPDKDADGKPIKLSDAEKAKNDQMEALQRAAVDVLKKSLTEKIQKNDKLDKNSQAGLLNAVKDLSPGQHKFNVGMYGGNLEGYKFNDEGALEVTVSKSAMHKQMQDMFEMGQAGFVKMLDSYKDEKGKEFVKKQVDAETVEVKLGDPPVMVFNIISEGKAVKDGGSERAALEAKNVALLETFKKAEKEWVETRAALGNEIRGVTLEAASKFEKEPTDTNFVNMITGLEAGISKASPEDILQLRSIVDRLNKDDDKLSEDDNKKNKVKIAAEIKTFMTTAEKKYINA
ncbi:MAG: hypothetical protein WCJ29_04510 [bacterium]